MILLCAVTHSWSIFLIFTEGDAPDLDTLATGTRERHSYSFGLAAGQGVVPFGPCLTTRQALFSLAQPKH